MATEVELAGFAALRAWAKGGKKGPPPEGATCLNCGAALKGPFCHACGQSADDFHRNAFRLVTDAFGAFFNFDGRFWQTVPGLFWPPGKLAKRFIDGGRQRQIPPFRMFLVVLLVFFSVEVSLIDRGQIEDFNLAEAAFDASNAVSADELRTLLDDADLEELRDILSGVDRLESLGVDTAGLRQEVIDAIAAAESQPVDDPPPDTDADGSQAPDTSDAPDISMDLVENWTLFGMNDAQWGEQLRKAQDNPELFFAVLETWAPRIAIGVPFVLAGILGLLYVYRLKRRVYLFDHMIVSLHLTTFWLICGLAITALARAAPGWIWLLVLSMFVHLALTLRGAYGSGWFSTVPKTFLIFLGLCVAVLFLVLTLLAIGVATI